MKELRTQFRAIVFGITGIIVAFLLFRVGVDLIGASTSNPLVGFIHTVSNFFISPFAGIIVLPIGTFSNLNVDALLSAGIYILAAIAFTEIVTAFMQDTLEEIIQNVVDAIFKFVEFLLILRIVFELFGVLDNASSPAFVRAVYGLTGWSQGVLFRIGFGNGFVDFSAIICLVIVAVLDLLCERFLASLFKQVTKLTETVRVKREFRSPPPPSATRVESTINHAPYMIPPQQPLHQNITINVPVPNQVIQPVIPVPVRPGTTTVTTTRPKTITARPVKPNEG